MRTTLRESLEKAQDVLAVVSRLGVRLGRFEAYLGVLRETATTLTSPVGRPWLGDANRDRLFYEAASQTLQLVESFPVWRWEDPETVRAKLRRICKGSALPPPAGKDDDSRNTLAEFACAAILHRKGFSCRLSADAEDLEARLPNMKPFAVEAKMPAHLKSLADNAKSMRSQLGQRISGGSRNGLAVFAADRILGLADGDLVLDRADRLDDVLGGHVTKLVQALQQPRHRLFPRAALGAILSTGAVFCADPGFIVTISAMGFFCTGPEDDPLSVQLYQALRPKVDHSHLMR